MGEWTTVYKEGLAMEMAVKAAAMEEEAKRGDGRRRGAWGSSCAGRSQGEHHP